EGDGDERMERHELRRRDARLAGIGDQQRFLACAWLEDDRLGIDLDHRAVYIAAHGHVGPRYGRKGIGAAVEQFRQDNCNPPRIARRDRYMVDHSRSLLVSDRSNLRSAHCATISARANSITSETQASGR